MATLYIIRGLPGSGKTTLGRRLCPNACFAADDYFTDENGRYEFIGSRLAEAHAHCYARVSESIRNGVDTAVANTFSRFNEYSPYLRLTERVVTIDLFNQRLSDKALAERCVHNVPVATIRNMRERWHHWLRSSDQAFS